MMGHKICFMEKYSQLSLNYPCYPFLFGALHCTPTVNCYGHVGAEVNGHILYIFYREALAAM